VIGPDPEKNNYFFFASPDADSPDAALFEERPHPIAVVALQHQRLALDRAARTPARP